MSDYEIDEIRRIRRQISEKHGHDMHKVAEYYRSIENQLKETGRYRFAEEPGCHSDVRRGHADN